ncbi:MAG: PilZ domain-containing protein, partial [Proteobacteria bacterium]|nr:PilZ domain-containing protein [Pseudomonadota bacterium]
LYVSSLPEYLAMQVSKPLEFQIRSLLKKSPPLDPRLKIFAFDDKTLNYLGYPDLTLDSWYNLIAQYASSKPQAIYIDKIFGIVLRDRLYQELNPQMAKEFVEKIRALNVPVIVGGFISPRQIQGRQLISLFHEDYSFNQAQLDSPSAILNDKTWPAIEQGYFYGPESLIRDAFHVGHITNSEFGYAKAFYRVDPQSWIPHIGLLAFGPLKIKEGQLTLRGLAIPLNSRNQITLNFSDRDSYISRTKSLSASIERINQQKPEPQIAPGDIVVILPAMFTGNTDFKDSPIGRLQGGYYGVTLMNSVLNQAWIKESGAVNLCLFIICCVASIFLALFLKPLVSILTLFAVLILVPFFGVYCFVWEAWSSAWLFVTLASISSGILLFVERIRGENYRSKTLLSTLRGAMSPQLAENLARNPAALYGDPVEQIVTIMFVDIVGFSLTTERQSPIKAFKQLKEQLHFIVDKVHSFDGLVDKSLGDGVMAFFGYHFQDNQVRIGHADRALQCAIEIQREAVKRAMQGIAGDAAIYPLRIGINTATVYIGNLGTEGRVDFTLIGNGVNFTARLEHACSPFKIMLGLSTFDLLAQFMPNLPNFRLRHIEIKHHKKPVKCYEYHPLLGDEVELKRVLRTYMQYHSIGSHEPRWCLDQADYLEFKTQFGSAFLVNFSEGGVALLLPQSLAAGESILLTLVKQQSRDPNLSIGVTVCWARGQDELNYLHGCQFLGHEEQKAEVFVENLRKYLKDSGRKTENLARAQQDIARSS